MTKPTRIKCAGCGVVFEATRATKMCSECRAKRAVEKRRARTKAGREQRRDQQILARERRYALHREKLRSPDNV